MVFEQSHPSLTILLIHFLVYLFLILVSNSHHQFRYGFFSLNRGLASLSRQMVVLKKMPVMQATKPLFTQNHPSNHQSLSADSWGPLG